MGNAVADTENIVAQTAERIFADLADAQTINHDRKGVWKAPLWSALSEAGLPLSWVAEECGGSGASLAEGDWQNAAAALGLVALFVGVPRPAASSCSAAAAVGAIVLAMGLENAMFQIQGGVGLGLTYVTGALVKAGQLIAAALKGEDRWGWVPNLLLWAALVAGAACGALAYQRLSLGAIWFAAALSLAPSGLFAAVTGRERQH